MSDFVMPDRVNEQPGSKPFERFEEYLREIDRLHDWFEKEWGVKPQPRETMEGPFLL